MRKNAFSSRLQYKTKNPQFAVQGKEKKLFCEMCSIKEKAFAQKATLQKVIYQGSVFAHFFQISQHGTAVQKTATPIPTTQAALITSTNFAMTKQTRLAYVIPARSATRKKKVIGPSHLFGCAGVTSQTGR